MIKKISFDDIKIKLSYRNPYEIMRAMCDNKSIALYFNDTQRVSVIQKSAQDYIYLYEEITADSNKNASKRKTIKKQNANKALKSEKLNKIFYDCLPLFLSFALTSIFYYLLHIKYVLSFSVSCIIAIIIMMIITIHKSVLNQNETSSALKSNHGAEHMIVNFVKKKHRLPYNLEELKQSSQIDIFCGTADTIPVSLLNVIVTFTILSTLFIIFLLILGCFKMSFQCNVFFLILYVYVKEKLHFRTIQNFFCTILSCIDQYVTIPKGNISKESLLMAYIAAANWMYIVFPKEFNLIAYKNFLKKEKIRIRYE